MILWTDDAIFDVPKGSLRNVQNGQLLIRLPTHRSVEHNCYSRQFRLSQRESV